MNEKLRNQHELFIANIENERVSEINRRLANLDTTELNNKKADLDTILQNTLTELNNKKEEKKTVAEREYRQKKEALERDYQSTLADIDYDYNEDVNTITKSVTDKKAELDNNFRKSIENDVNSEYDAYIEKLKNCF